MAVARALVVCSVGAAAAMVHSLLLKKLLARWYKQKYGGLQSKQ